MWMEASERSKGRRQQWRVELYGEGEKTEWHRGVIFKYVT